MSSRKLSPEQREELLTVLKTRFEENMSRHEAIDWAEVQARLEGEDRKVWSLHRMASLRHRLPIPQRSPILLRHKGVPGLAQGVGSATALSSRFGFSTPDRPR